MHIFRVLAPLPLALALCAAPARGQSGSAPLPVREVSVFKDGHAFLVRAATRRTDAQGELALDDLPEPVLGTFWPFAEGDAKLLSARASQVRVSEEREARDLAELLLANAGVVVTLTDMDGTKLEGRVLGLVRPEPASVPPGTSAPAEQPVTVPPAPGASLGPLVRLESGGESRVVPLRRVRELAVRGELRPRFRSEIWRERLTLRCDRASAEVVLGVAYVQQGLRWIPSYRLDLEDGGKARLRLEATLVNDLEDLADTTVHFVVGAPRFEYAGELDPIAMRAAVTSVAARGYSNFPNNPAFLSNALMTQSAAYGASVERAPLPAEGAASEDLYLYTVRGITLAKGERLVLPLTETVLAYRDVYTLAVPLAPPDGLQWNVRDEQDLRLLRELVRPKAVHTLRLSNAGSAPLTTAPVLVLRDGHLLAQSRTSYTPAGSSCDVAINTAVNVLVDVDQRELGRKDATLIGRQFQEISFQGAIALTNHEDAPIELEVERDVAGILGALGQGGKPEALEWGAFVLDAPPWWSRIAWESWWYRLNGLARVRWTLRLEPGASTCLEAEWRLYWN